MSTTFHHTPEEWSSSEAMRGRPRRNGSNSVMLSDIQLQAALCRERRRSERSGRPFLLMLAHLDHASDTEGQNLVVQKFLGVMGAAVRETDVVGWYRSDEVLGFIFTELGEAEKSAVLQSLKQRARNAVYHEAYGTESLPIRCTFHFFPEDGETNGLAADLNLYPELTQETGARKIGRTVKRTIDVFSAALALILLSSLFFIIAVLIKMTSKGPVLFRQIRIGQHGKTFTFLKFRSMYVNSDSSIHKDYVTRFIAGETDLSMPHGKPNVYKITNDPRITPLGLFLRKTSLDELPQLVNVLRGEMSLVGPRPPLPYEYQHYDIWHRRRVLEIKPGITGLWQVSGRSRTSFDDMVRLDLQYGREWSLWLDLKILLQTPKAVLFGDGAY